MRTHTANGIYAPVVKHLQTAPLDQTRRWVRGSVTRRPGLEISVVATRDTDDQVYPLRGQSTVVHALHLSLCAVTPNSYAALPDEDLLAWGRGVFGARLERTWVEPPASPFDLRRRTAAARFTTHVLLYVDHAGQPTAPTGRLYGQRPWAEALRSVAAR